MPTSTNGTHQVIVAGAGPVGLCLACELRLAGCSVLVLEKQPSPSSPLKALPFGLRGLSVPTVEAFDRRGLLDAVRAAAVGRDAPAVAHWMKQPRSPAGHFAGIQFFQDQVDTAQWPYRVSASTAPVAVEMATIETVLATRAEALGVVVRRGLAVDAVEQGEAGVVVHAGGLQFAAGWLVGCDGARSAVRKAAGIGFAGTDPEFTGYSVAVTLDDPERLRPGRHTTAAGMYTFAPPGTIAMADFDGGAFHRTAPVTRDHVETVLRRVTGTDVSVTAVAVAATWTDRAFLAGDYRRGRVLLAGDAAHVHAPLGGQGLNLGLGDAMNLGWKLAATIRGQAPAGLLDSYMAERKPIAAAVLEWSRAQVALMRPSPSARALESIVRDLIATRDGATYFAERVSGVGLRYDLGEPHPLAGRSAPDVTLDDGTRLNQHLRWGRGLLVDFEGRPALGQLCARWRHSIDHVATDAAERLGLSALLIRPDGIVAWATDGAVDEDALADTLARWFGEARPESG